MYPGSQIRLLHVRYQPPFWYLRTPHPPTYSPCQAYYHWNETVSHENVAHLLASTIVLKATSTLHRKLLMIDDGLGRGRVYGIILDDSYKSMAPPFLFQDTAMNKPNPSFYGFYALLAVCTQKNCS